MMDDKGTITEKINSFIEQEGKGNIRDALNVALTRLENMTFSRDYWKQEALNDIAQIYDLKVEIEQLNRDFLTHNSDE
jgi:hypothetical protein